MAKFFIDFEFHSWDKPVKSFGFNTGQTVRHCEPMSIGMRSTDERNLHIVFKEFDVDAAWKNPFLIKNVIPALYFDLLMADGSDLKIRSNVMAREGVEYPTSSMTKSRFKELLSQHGYTAEQAVKEITKFTSGSMGISHEFFGWFSSYDWFLFCEIHGGLMNLPSNYSQYCNDLVSMLNIHAEDVAHLNKMSSGLQLAQSLRYEPGYPRKPSNAHNALVDACWNERMYNFITNQKLQYVATKLESGN